MSPFYKTTLASSLLSLALFTGVAEAGRNTSGPTQVSRPQQTMPSVSKPASIYSAPIKKVEPRRPEFRPEFRPVTKIASLPKATAKDRPEPSIKAAQQPKSDPRTTTKIEHLKQQPATQVAKDGKSGLTPFKKIEPVKIAASAVGAKILATQLTSLQQRRLAPVTDARQHVSDKSMNHFVATQVLRRQAAVITKADGAAKYQAAVSRATTLIKDPSKGYQITKYGDAKKPGEQPKGDTGTIVINENNKTVYVPASTVSGPGSPDYHCQLQQLQSRHRRR